MKRFWKQNAPRQWADSVLKPEEKQRESDPASPDGAFYLCFSEGTYTFQTWSYHTDKNTAVSPRFFVTRL